MVAGELTTAAASDERSWRSEGLRKEGAAVSGNE